MIEKSLVRYFFSRFDTCPCPHGHCRPREGCGLHLCTSKLPWYHMKGCRPREGCGLHPEVRHHHVGEILHVAVPVRGVGCIRGGLVWYGIQTRIVAVPVRGVDCIPRAARAYLQCTEVAVPVRGVGCIPTSMSSSRVTSLSSCRPREGCGLHPLSMRDSL